jgi:dihydrofolate reductase
MSKLRVHNFVVSLDGYATGDGQSTSAAFGDAQREFLDWFGKIRIFRGTQADGKLGPDEAIASAWGTGIGAEIMGRNKFRPTTGPWPDDGWRGWWGEEPPFHTPCFVMTHYEREPMVVGNTTFYFVSGSPAEVLERAREAAGWAGRPPGRGA